MPLPFPLGNEAIVYTTCVWKSSVPVVKGCEPLCVHVHVYAGACTLYLSPTLSGDNGLDGNETILYVMMSSKVRVVSPCMHLFQPCQAS